MKTFIQLLLCLLLLPITASGEALPTLAVVDFDATSTQYNFLGRQTAELINDAVINTGLFSVVERDKLKSLVTEQSFSGSGIVDPNSAIKMGSMSGASYLMTGKVISASVGSKTFRGYGVTTTNKTFSMKASAKVLDTKTGRVLFSGTESASNSTQATNTLQVGNDGIFVALAEEIANRFADRLSQSGQFVPAEKEEKLTFVNVMFNSTPESADVEVDGVFYGNAGDAIAVPGGMHMVKISLSGYDGWEKKVMLRDGMSIRATLQKSADIRVSHD